MRYYDLVMFCCLFGLPFIGFAGFGVIDSWNQQQTRMMYQTTYQKNMECRISYSKSSGNDFVNKVCGEIPKWENFKK